MGRSNTGGKGGKGRKSGKKSKGNQGRKHSGKGGQSKRKGGAKGKKPATRRRATATPLASAPLPQQPPALDEGEINAAAGKYKVGAKYKARPGFVFAAVLGVLLICGALGWVVLSGGKDHSDDKEVVDEYHAHYTHSRKVQSQPKVVATSHPAPASKPTTQTVTVSTDPAPND